MNEYFTKADQIGEEMKEILRDLRRRPESGVLENRTSQIVAAYLNDLGLEVATGVGGSGLTAMLYALESGPTVAIRADMEVQPNAASGKPPSASHEDTTTCECYAHAVMALGSARLLTEISDTLQGNIKWIFQPRGEPPLAGALSMIRDGVLESPEVDALFGLHLVPVIPQGAVAVKSGHATLAGAGFQLNMIGKGGHATRPQDCIDPVVMAGMAVTTSQNIIARRTNPLEPSILAFTSIRGGEGRELIPDEVELSGMIRCLRSDDRFRLAEMLEANAEGIASACGGQARLDVTMQSPSVYNNPELVTLWKASAGAVLSESSVIELEKPVMWGDDIAYFLEKVPGVFWWLGTGDTESNLAAPLHGICKNFDEERVLPVGAAVHARCAADFLLRRGL
jgi:amidohydrolase